MIYVISDIHGCYDEYIELLKKLCVEVTLENAEERESVLEYLEEFSVYEELEVNGKEYVLVHAGINEFAESKEWEEYSLADLLFYRADYKKRYFGDCNKFLVTGHTPTPRLRADRKPLVFEGNGHIALDCGCVFGGRLAAYCFDTGEVTYVDSLLKK